ncbi:hypothetical protein BLSTO_05586 [Blastocystis sp. subtype 1]
MVTRVGDCDMVGDTRLIDAEDVVIESLCVGDRCERDEVTRELFLLQDQLRGVLQQNESLLQTVQPQALLAHTAQFRRAQEADNLLAAYCLYLRGRVPARVPPPAARCSVCNRALGPSPMQCAACGCRVHPHCYGYLLKPAAPWLCCVCEDIASTLLHLPHGDVSPATLSSIAPLRRQVRCCLCGIAAGAMVATPVSGVYAHVCCGVWLKECAISNHAPLGRSAFDAFFLSPRHFPLVVNPAALRRPSASQGSDPSPCQFCGRTGGVVCCQRSGCERCFHVMCGYARGLELDFRVSAALRSDFRDCVLLSARHTHLCAQHAAEVFEGEVPWDVRVDGEVSGDVKVDGEVSGDVKVDGEVSGEAPSGGNY